jgi:hypothetical protein
MSELYLLPPVLKIQLQILKSIYNYIFSFFELPDLIRIYGTEGLNMLLSSKSILAESRNGRFPPPFKVGLARSIRQCRTGKMKTLEDKYKSN